VVLYVKWLIIILSTGEVVEEKKINLTAAILVFLVVTISIIVFSLMQTDSVLDSEKQQKIAVDLPAPNFTFPDLNGKMVSLVDYKGKVVLVNIWATWCPPCVDEMPSMEKLYQLLNGENFEILAVSIDTKGRKVVAPFMKKYKLTFPALIDSKGIIKTTYKTTGVPESFIIDKQGILIKKIIGPLNWANPEVFGFLKDLIQRPVS
jgi:peroxiredoxin